MYGYITVRESEDIEPSDELKVHTKLRRCLSTALKWTPTRKLAFYGLCGASRQDIMSPSTSGSPTAMYDHSADVLGPLPSYIPVETTLSSSTCVSRMERGKALAQHKYVEGISHQSRTSSSAFRYPNTCNGYERDSQI